MTPHLEPRVGNRVRVGLAGVAALCIALCPAVIAAEPAGPCGIEVTYYVPEPPIIQSSAGSVSAADQVAIRCDYRAVTAHVEWPVCNAEAQAAMQVLRFAQESGSRYSGILNIDGQNVGVATSPAGGGDFSSEKLWSYGGAGGHEVACQIDNGLKHAAKNGLDYLLQSVRHDVAAAAGIDSLPLDLNALKRIAVNRLQEQIAPLPEGATALLRVIADSSFDPTNDYSYVELESGAVSENDDWNDASNGYDGRHEASLPGYAGDANLPPQSPPPHGASSTDEAGFWLKSFGLFRMDSQHMPIDSQSYQTGDTLVFQCRIYSSGIPVGAGVRFRFTVNGEVVRDVLAPTPKTGKYTTMETEWFPSSAGTYRAACEVNYDHAIAETDYTDNIRERDIVVSKLPDANAGPAQATALMLPPAAVLKMMPKAMETAGTQASDGTMPLRPDLAVLKSGAELRCNNGVPQLLVTGTVQNISAVTFAPPAINPLVHASLMHNAHLYTGRAILPTMPPGDIRDFTVDVSIGKDLVAAELLGESYMGQFGVNFPQVIKEPEPITNNYRDFEGTFPEKNCP